MSKFQVGDKVALRNNPNKPIGRIEGETFSGYYVEIGCGYHTVMSEDSLVPYHDNIPDMTNNEIYYMLKPKLEKAEAIKNRYNMTTVNVNEDVGLAYRSGYLRAKKGRPFKIGGEKE